MKNHFPELVSELSESPDKSARGAGEPWVGIIIHHTDIGGRKEVSEALWRQLFRGITGWLTKADANYLSAHYHIGRFGECAQLVDPDTHKAFHAGTSSYYHPIKRVWASGWNSYAIGIELLGDGNMHSYSEEQYEKLSKLCAALMKKYPTIDPRCITGHENIAPGRKQDPGKLFNWRYFFEKLMKSA